MAEKEAKVKSMNKEKVENEQESKTKVGESNIDWSSLVDYDVNRIEHFLNMTGNDVLDLNDETFKTEKEELQDIVDRFGKSIQKKQYPSEITVSEIKTLAKWLENYANWNYQNASNLTATKESIDKIINESKKDEEKTNLGRVIIQNSYNFLIGADGKGYKEAKAYVRTLTKVGEKITSLMKDVNEENTYFRELHSVLALYDQRTEGILSESIKKQEESESPDSDSESESSG